ncbi:MAG: hypothetical protein PHE32_03985 [Candidatus Shapirobacteria bacterium]|nr:hypothetical protein [Candidatus Shapirobacteria bacterium]
MDFTKIKKPISAFYTKSVDVGSLGTTKDNYGGVVKGSFTKTSTIKVNLNLSDTKVREQFGINSDVEVTMTFEPLNSNFTHVKIDDKIYQIQAVNKFTSHWKALLK